MDINSNKLERLFKKFNYDIVINLAAQAGVRYSIYNPNVYFNSNVKGFFNLLDNCRKYKIKHLLFASTSSVYGNSKKFPLKENYSTDKPLSFYAATKKTNETMAFSYSAIYKIPITTLRFFTVFGPLGRPDMSLYKFTNSILKNKAIDIYNYGNHVRDFTYVDDVVKIIQKLIKKTPKKDIPFEIYNIASSSPKKLKYFIKIIEKNLKKTAKKKFLPLQKGDVYKTHASINKLKKIIKVEKITPIEEGISRFVNWFKNY